MMNEGYQVALLSQNGAVIGYLNPMSCEISETLNGDDNMQLSCVYDADGLWKEIKPGNRIGVWMEKQTIAASSVNMFTDRYVVQNASYDDRAYWEKTNINHVDNTYYGHLSVGQTVTVVDSYKTQEDTVYAILKTNGIFYVKSGILKVVRVNGDWPGDTIDDQDHNQGHGTIEDTAQSGGSTSGGSDIPDVNAGTGGNTDSGTTGGTSGSGSTDGGDHPDDIPAVNDPGAPAYDTQYTFQQYAIRTVTMADTISVDAVHLTIESGERLAYFDQVKKNATLIVTINQWIQYAYNCLSVTRQKKPMVRGRCEAAAACAMSGIAMSMNELFCSHLREIYGYDFQRNGEYVDLYETVGRDRGTVLEVGRNLASMEIVVSNEDSDLDGVYGYCTYESGEGNRIAYSEDSHVKSLTNKTYTRYAIEESEDASNLFTAGYLNAVQTKLMTDADQMIDSGAYKLRGFYQVTLSPEPAQIDGVWDDEKVLLGDIVTIRDPRLPEGEVKRRVTQLTHDYLTGRITGMTVGDVPKSLYDVIKKMK